MNVRCLFKKELSDLQLADRFKYFIDLYIDYI